MARINKQRILNLFGQMYTKAEDIIKDPDRFKNMLKDARQVLDGKASGQLKEVVDKLKLFLSMLNDYRNGIYTELPLRSVLSIGGALLYLISPADIIPDFIPVIGMIDDIFIINLVWNQLRRDLDKYLLWKQGVSESSKTVIMPGEMKTEHVVVDAEIIDVEITGDNSDQ